MTRARMRPRHLSGFVVTLVATMAMAPTARADDAACIQAYEQAQTLRKEGKLREARDAATKCAQSSCPAILSKDCTAWMGELESSIPTIVFEVRGPGGEEVTAVKVLVDGQAVLDKIEGKSVPVDVGTHVFRFEPADGKPAVEQKVVVHEGDRNRKITVALGAGAPSSTGARPVPLPALVFGGAGVVALGLGTVFAINGSSKESDLEACKPACPADDVNSASSSYAAADILLTAGAVSLVAAAVFFLTRPSAPSAASATSRPARLRLEF